MSEQQASTPDPIDHNNDESNENASNNILTINYQLCFESINWLQHYFDYHHDTKSLRTIKPDEDISTEDFIEFAAENNLTLSELSSSAFNLERIESQLPIIVYTVQKNIQVILSKTPGHWQVYDVDQRNEKYLSDQELQSLEGIFKCSITFEKEQKSELLNSTEEKKYNWIIKEVFKHKAIYKDTLIASVVINIVALFIPLYTMSVYDKVVPNLAFNTLWVLSSIVVIGLIFDWILKQARSTLTDKIGQEIDTVLSTKILSRIMQSKSEHTPSSMGSFSKSFQDFDGVRDFLNSMTITTMVDLPFTLFFLAVIYLVAGPIVLAPITVMLLILGITLLAQNKVKSNIQKLSELRSKRAALSYETLQTLDTLKLNNAKPWMLKRWQDSVNECSEASYQSNVFSSKVSHTSQLLQQWMTIVIVVFGVFLISEGDLSMGGLIATTMLSGRAAGSILQISTLISRYQHAKEGMNSINSLLDMPPERPADDIAIERRTFHGDIKFDQVNFQYPGSETFAVKDISFSIKPGERVAFIGGIGSGKTTLLKLIQSLYLPTSGRLLFDNLDAKFWDVDLLRNNISAVDQHPKLFKETIYKNITIGNTNKVNDYHLSFALDQSGMSNILPKIEGGLEKSLGEANHGISGGQAQSIALARAFMKRSKLLIFDEPTSMMDKATEYTVLKSLKELPSSTTLILSTHNLGLLSAVDRVIILEQGKVKFDGSPESLKKGASND